MDLSAIDFYRARLGCIPVHTDSIRLAVGKFESALYNFLSSPPPLAKIQ